MAQKRPISEVSDEGATECDICYEKLEFVGNHRTVSLKCGHLFGEKCIRKWIDDCPTRLKCCPNCRHRAIADDIRIVYASKIVVVDDSEARNMQTELDNLKKKINDLEARQTNTPNRAPNIEFKKMKEQLANLRRLGIVYVECEICDQGFTNEIQKRVHKIRNHSAP